MNKAFRTLVIVFSCFLTCVCALTTVYVIINDSLDSLNLIGLCFVLITLLLGFIYLILGFSKDLSNMYIGCILIATVNALMSVILSLSEKYNTAALICTGLALVFYTVLLVGRNLGKTVSYALCILIIVIRVLGVIFNFVATNSFLNPQVINVCGQLAIILMVFIATTAKYIDKDNRGTK